MSDTLNTISASKNPALAAALREAELNKARGPWPRRLRIGGAALMILLIIGGAAWAIRIRLKANEKVAAKQVALASIKSPRDAFRAVQAGQLSWDDLEKLREERENKQMDEFFALKTQADRDRYLDKQIDEMEARRKEFQQRAATQPTTRPWQHSTTRPTSGPTTRPNRRNDPGQQLNRVQGGDPVRNAQRAAYRSAMRARMAARGIQGGGGRGGWGGGGGGRGHG